MSAEHGGQTLTSHIPIVNKRRNNGSAKRNVENTGNSNAKAPFNRNKGKQEGGPNGKFKTNGRTTQQGQRESFRGKPQKRKFEDRSPAANGASAAPAVKRPRADKLVAGIDPFELFCAYHLGIGPNREYKASNINEVAARFRSDPGTIKQTLKSYDMDPAALLDKDFDLALAQLDIQVAPEGIDRMELAIPLYEEFLEAPIKKRDWKKILDEDRKENMKVFGNR